MITMQFLKSQLPKNSSRIITNSMVDKINNLTRDDDEEFSSIYRANFTSYISVLKSGEFKITDYMSAVKYVSYKLMEHSNIDAYMFTFPDRYNRLLEENVSFGSEKEIRDKKISPYVSMYNKNKLVNNIMDQSLIPNHIINAPLYQSALNQQAYLMMHASTDLVRTQAANSILVHLKPPESSKVEIDIGFKKDDVIEDYKTAMMAMVQKQKELIAGGADVKDIANASVRPIEVEAIEADVS